MFPTSQNLSAWDISLIWDVYCSQSLFYSSGHLMYATMQRSSLYRFAQLVCQESCRPIHNNPPALPNSIFSRSPLLFTYLFHKSSAVLWSGTRRWRCWLLSSVLNGQYWHLYWLLSETLLRTEIALRIILFRLSFPTAWDPWWPRCFDFFACPHTRALRYS